MIDHTKLAIADVLKHSTLGLVSHQPIAQPTENEIRVMDLDGSFFYVSANECEWPSKEDMWRYWKEVKIKEATRENNNP